MERVKRAKRMKIDLSECMVVFLYLPNYEKIALVRAKITISFESIEVTPLGVHTMHLTFLKASFYLNKL
jgi:hypothetical protein